MGRSEYLGQMFGAMCEVTDTLAEDSWSGAQWDTGLWLASWSHRCMSRRLVHGCWRAIPSLPPRASGYAGSFFSFVML